MRLAAHWKTILQVILLAILNPARQIWRLSRRSTRRKVLPYRKTPIRPFLMAFGYPVVDEAVMRRVRAAQVSNVLRLTPLMIAGNLINAMALVAVGFAAVPIGLVLAWFLAVAGILFQMALQWRKFNRRPIEQASAKVIARAVRHATILSAVWAVVPVAALSFGDVFEFWVSSIVTIGMICGGGFALATVPQAAFRWLLVLYSVGVACLVTADIPQPWVLITLLTSFALIIIGSVASTSWLFTSNFLAESELRQRGDLISLMMNEIEEKDSDWLWETNALGRISNISIRFSTVAGRSFKELRAMQITDLASSLNLPEAHCAAETLSAAIESKSAFRALEIGVDVKGEERWWSLAGAPLYDDQGTFCGFRGVGSDITDVRRANALITQLAEQDSLTGIANRSWFLNRSEEMLAEQMKSGDKSLTLFLIDLDNFKVVNDTSGHPAGDELLKQVAKRFTSISEGRTVLARFGGDEFAALGSFASDEEAQAFADELVQVARKPFSICHREFAVGATVGFTRLCNANGTVDDLMREADIALYKAKETGRGRALAFAEEMQLEVRERRELETDLREAFENGKLDVEFQPIVDARSGKVISSEVLVRWQHPQRGDVGPDVFIPIAEHAGLILPLGAWVLDKACRIAARCPDLETVAVNLSAVQFMDPNLVETISDVLMETGFPGERLVLEITESVFLKDVGSASDKLQQLKDMGIRIALDDFGTGYSSLLYLRQYNFDKIKIDKSFVDEIGEQSEGLAIISAIIALAHNIGLEVTAEGVERQFQVDALRTLGCDNLQGYYFGRPNADPMKITAVRKEAWEDRAPSTAPGNRKRVTAGQD
ncbi:bifunctional diguanylate cyclase/phosphodiesterase [Labrenzia sp. PHM005]|uniref:putative bifunctional diguanylate cyclase/phosphodiesterase n=1 Tax=Labrenzia sp. PHM005 TaxID=2590016 RepID=UPI0011403B0E|nr:EAL domain-containing protein [Labrenzia sp. PHM005]QDG78796.1 EAL domain-containing protein [Labrenzia sp. PHM005]